MGFGTPISKNNSFTFLKFSENKLPNNMLMPRSMGWHLLPSWKSGFATDLTKQKAFTSISNADSEFLIRGADPLGSRQQRILPKKLHKIENNLGRREGHAPKALPRSANAFVVY